MWGWESLTRRGPPGRRYCLDFGRAFTAKRGKKIFGIERWDGIQACGPGKGATRLWDRSYWGKISYWSIGVVGA